MLTPLEKNAISDHYKAISQNLPGFCPRTAQRQMIAAVANALSRSLKKSEDEEVTRQGESIVVIEGPTGVGKSLAYLLAGGIMAQTREKKLVVSSATVALQEQLVNRDLPFLIEKSGLELTFALAKGRGRYLCPYRLYQLTQDHAQGALMGFEEVAALWTDKPRPEDVAQLRELADAFSQRHFNGDRDTWHENIPDALWAKTTNDRHGCLKAACPNKPECPFYLAREVLETVDVVVANHDLLLADISMGGGVILPAPSQSFYCIDEAHHLAKKALNQFAAEHSLNQSQWFLERLPKLTAQLASITDKMELANQAEDAADALLEHFSEWMWQLNDAPQLAGSNDVDMPIWLWDDGAIPEALAVLVQNTAISARMLVKNLHGLSEALGNTRKDKGSDSALIDKVASELGMAIARAEQMNAVWDLMEEVPKEKAPPLAKWITSKRHDKNDYVFNASPVSAASHLASSLWQQAAGAVLTSATLQSLGNFDLLLKQTGLMWFKEVETVALESPFNFQEQGELYLPPIQASPKDALAHTNDLVDWLPKLIDLDQGVGSLVLFSSRKQMQDVALRLPDDYVAKLLVQGDMPKATLLARHHEAIAKKEASIIFGLDSFAEGLDLPGYACVHVIIAKLPFSMPDNPIDKTLSRWIEKNGGNPFVELTVPETSIKLVQAVGRLIRTETDHGRVSILDNRVKTAGYGKRLLASLPNFKRI